MTHHAPGTWGRLGHFWVMASKLNFSGISMDVGYQAWMPLITRRAKIATRPPQKNLLSRMTVPPPGSWSISILANEAMGYRNRSFEDHCRWTIRLMQTTPIAVRPIRGNQKTSGSFQYVQGIWRMSLTSLSGSSLQGVFWSGGLKPFLKP